MKKTFLILTLFVLSFALKADDSSTIKQIMASQEVAWNNGDLEGFYGWILAV